MSNPVDVQSVLDEIRRIVERFQSHPEEKSVLEADLREVVVGIKGDIDERHDELFRALNDAAKTLGILFEPDVGLTLAEIQAEIRRSAARQKQTTD